MTMHFSTKSVTRYGATAIDNRTYYFCKIFQRINLSRDFRSFFLFYSISSAKLNVPVFDELTAELSNCL